MRTLRVLESFRQCHPSRCIIKPPLAQILIAVGGSNKNLPRRPIFCLKLMCNVVYYYLVALQAVLMWVKRRRGNRPKRPEPSWYAISLSRLLVLLLNCKKKKEEGCHSFEMDHYCCSWKLVEVNWLLMSGLFYLFIKALLLSVVSPLSLAKTLQ